ncbi:unnamed protein product [Ectocarpus fasciculatus]
MGLLDGLFGPEGGEDGGKAGDILGGADATAAGGPPLAKDTPPPQDPGIYSQGGAGFNAEPMERAVQLAFELGRERNPSILAHERRSKLTKTRAEVSDKTEEFHRWATEADKHIDHKVREEAARMRELKDEHSRAREEFRDRLKRQRAVDKMQLAKIEREKQQEMEEELAAKQEQIRRETIELEAQLRQKTELERVRMETEGRILAERKNHDLRLEQKRQQAADTRETVLSGLKLTGETLGQGVAEFLGNRQEMTAVVLGLSAAALGIYSAKMGTGVMGRYVEARLGRPSLVRETSRRSAGEILKHPLQGARRLFKSVKPGDALEGDASLPKAIFVPQMEQRLRRVAESSSNTRANRAPFRHLLLHAGPPGTGKTLFAKGLARHSGLDYAIITGGDVAPLGREAVSEMHKLFDWAQASRRGVLLFVDEADAFLRRRSTERISEDMRNALNAFLYRTGEQTDRFMVVYASNQPEQFDDAINDRIDEMVPFELPEFEERYRMLTYYMSKYLLNAVGGKNAATIVVEGVEEEHIKEAAEVTKGFSGRELSKLAIAWQAAAYGSDPAAFTPELMASVTDTFLEQKAIKTKWDTAAAASFGEDIGSSARPGFPQNGAGLPQMA